MKVMFFSNVSKVVFLQLLLFQCQNHQDQLLLEHVGHCQILDF